MEQRMMTPQEKCERIYSIMNSKIDLIADYVQKGMTEFAMIELGSLNEYARLQLETAIKEIPNNNY